MKKICCAAITGVALLWLVSGAYCATLFSDDFSSDTMGKWTVYDQGLSGGPSKWQIKDGALHQPTNIFHMTIQNVPDKPKKEWLGTIAVAGDPTWTDYRLEFDFTTDDNDGIGCVFRFTDTGNYYHFQVDAEARFFQVTKKLNGAFYHLASGEAAYEVGAQNHVAVRLAGPKIEVSLNGKSLVTVDDPHLKRGMIGLETRGCDRSRFDNVLVDGDPGQALDAQTPAGSKVLFADEFEKDTIADWQVTDIGDYEAPSKWSIAEGAMHQTSNIYERVVDHQHPDRDWTGTFLVSKKAVFADGIVDTVMWSTDDDGIGVVWRWKDARNYYKFQIDGSGKFWQISKKVAGKFTCLASGKDKWYIKGLKFRVQVRAQGAKMAVYLDDKVVGVVQDSDLAEGSVGFESRGNSGSHFDFIRTMESDENVDLGAFRGQMIRQFANAIRLEHMACLPGQELTASLPPATAELLADLRLEVCDAGGQALARVTPEAGKQSVNLWRNTGANPGVYDVVVLDKDAQVRRFPFNVWERVPPDIGLCAHRGDNYNAPENTIPALKLAAEKGAHQIELDVYTSSDGKLVVIHDSTLDRTTDGSGPVIAKTLDELRGLDAGSWKGEQWKGTRIPTFREALEAIPEHIQVNCHLKSGKGLGEQVAREIVSMGRLNQCFLACGTSQAQEAKAVEPGIRICNMEGSQSPTSGYPQQTIDMGANYIQLWGWADELPRICARLRDGGVNINYFGTSDPEEFRRLIEAGVQYPLTDHLDAMIPVLRDLGISMATGPV